jgi:hypothetical protein
MGGHSPPGVKAEGCYGLFYETRKYRLGGFRKEMKKGLIAVKSLKGCVENLHTRNGRDTYAIW